MPATRNLRPNLRPLIENILIAQVLLCVFVSSWGFGGKSYWIEISIMIIASSTILPFFIAVTGVPHIRRRVIKSSPWLILWILLIAQVIVSIYTTHYDAFQATLTRDITHLDSFYLIPITADSELSLRKLLLFSSIGLMGFVLLHCMTSFRKIRILLIFMATNAFIISAFGLIQKLSGTNEVFWSIPIPSNTFFASFVYHNHWAAFALINFSLICGLLLRKVKQLSLRDFLSRSTILPFGCSLILIAGTIVLSTSRSGTILLVTYSLLVFAWMLRIGLNKKNRTDKGHRLILPLVGLMLITGLIGAWFYSLTPPSMRSEFKTLSKQAEQLGTHNWVRDMRVYAYKHTLDMIQERPVWGWGLGNFQKAFPIFQGHPYIHKNNLPRYFYRHAHNDWLETVSEIGIIGIMLLLAPLIAAIYPIIKSHKPLRLLPGGMLLGVCVILLYSMIDFPLASPAVAVTTAILFVMGIRYQQVES